MVRKVVRKRKVKVKVKVPRKVGRKVARKNDSSSKTRTRETKMRGKKREGIDLKELIQTIVTQTLRTELIRQNVVTHDELPALIRQFLGVEETSVVPTIDLPAFSNAAPAEQPMKKGRRKRGTPLTEEEVAARKEQQRVYMRERYARLKAEKDAEKVASKAKVVLKADVEEDEEEEDVRPKTLRQKQNNSSNVEIVPEVSLNV